MHIFTDFIIRHRKYIVFYAFFLSLLLSSEISKLEYIKLKVDPISYSEFYLDKYYPLIQIDRVNKKIMIDGQLNSPNSIYSFDPQLLIVTDDSIKTKSMLSYKQGGYKYRQLGLNITTKSTSNGLMKFIANTIIYPGPYNSYGEDNLFQNYLLSYDKNILNGFLYLYAGYHIENNDIGYINTYSGESYFGGLSIRNIYKNDPGMIHKQTRMNTEMIQR